MTIVGFTGSLKLCEPNLCEPNLCEPNLCEPGSHDFSVNFDLRFTFSQSSHKSHEPVNLGSHIKINLRKKSVN